MLRRGLLMFAAALPLAGFRPVPEEDVRPLVERACADEADTHRAILAALEQRLDVRFTDAETRAMLGALRCPNCGCALLAEARDTETAPGPF
jgi:hypothetical protein